LLKPEERRVDRSFVQSEHVFTQLLDTPRNAEAMQWAKSVQCFEDHQIQGSL
jgi:hypothetical protein